MKLFTVAALFVLSALSLSSEAQPLSQACDSLIQRVFAGNAPNCVCEPDISSFSVFLACEAAERVCVVPGSELLCGFPQVEFDFNVRQLFIGKLPFTTSICYANATIAENPIPSQIPFCIDSGESPLAFLRGDGLVGDAVPAINVSAVDGTPCNAGFGEKACTSCIVCDAASGSIAFNCSNIEPSFVSNECVSLQLGL